MYRLGVQCQGREGSGLARCKAVGVVVCHVHYLVVQAALSSE